ncbi:MAG: FtsW/RodA/SpoVE family cell cycle protein [Erysipelotrichia bacterium]|nr:FtsW/RodA/SpoVE family cell cycle protein [Erysipelotrichia bacterium]
MYLRKLKGLSLRMPRNYDKIMHLCILILLVFGTIMIASTSVGETSATESNIVTKTIIKQCIFLVVTYIAMTFIARNFVKLLSREVKLRDNTNENRKAKNFYRGLFRILGFVIIGMLLYTVLFGDTINGSKAWINLKFASLQPSEFAKAYMIILLGLIINDYGQKKLTFAQLMKEPLIFFVMSVLLIFLQNDNGTLMVFVAITTFCLLIPSNPCLNKLKRILLYGIGAAVIGLIFLSTDLGMSILEKFDLGYKFHRFTSAADPFSDLYNTGYNLAYSLYAIASGNLFGLGLGASKQKYGYLPEASTDFIFAVTIEETGIIGLILIVGCYALIIYKLFYYAMKTRSEGYKIILIGTAVYMCVHFILNVGGISALIPLTGVPLLFISSGGSSLISIMCLMGVCQSIIALTKGQMAKLEDKHD